MRGPRGTWLSQYQHAVLACRPKLLTGEPVLLIYKGTFMGATLRGASFCRELLHLWSMCDVSRNVNELIMLWGIWGKKSMHKYFLSSSHISCDQVTRSRHGLLRASWKKRKWCIFGVKICKLRIIFRVYCHFRLTNWHTLYHVEMTMQSDKH